MNAPWKLICLILSLVFFGISAGATAWAAPADYWHGRFISAGLFFLVLSMLIS
jgi:hypothetical protein